MPFRVIAPALLALLLLISGCNAETAGLPTPDENNDIYVTATPILPTPDEQGFINITATPNPAQPNTETVQQMPTAQQPATSPPTIAPTGTPIPNPNEALDRAAQQVRNGYLEEAVSTYQTLLQQPGLGDEVRAEAGFRLGQAAVKEGLFADAVEALTLLIDRFPDDPRISQAYFLRGDAYLGLAQWNNAIQDLQRYLTLRPGLVDSYAYERIADAQLALGQNDTALASYQQALEAGRTLIPQLILRERVAEILISFSRTEEAVAQYDAILSVARNAPYRADIQLDAAQAYLRGDQTEAAVQRARQVFDNYPSTRPAYDAMLILLQNDIALDGWQRGRVYYNRGEYVQAIEAFNEYTSNYQLSAIPAELYLLLGRAYREIGSSDAALVAFQTLIEQYPDNPLFGEALLEQGRTRFLAGDFQDAIDFYLSIARDYSYLGEPAAEALWRAGYLYSVRLEQPVQSRETFLRLAENYPNSTWAQSGLELAASVAVSNGETAIAENLYGRIASLTTGEDQASAYYQVGRLAQQQGNTQAAQEAFNLAQQAAPDSFFSARAGDIVQGREAFQPPAQTRFTFDTQSERLAAEDWLRTTYDIQQTGDLHQLSPELENDPRMIRGRELWAIAAYDEAREEFDSLLDEARDTGNMLQTYQLAHFFRDIGANRESIVAGADLIVYANLSTQDVPPYIGRFRYPAYYIDLILPQTERYGFSPLLMLSLMHQESLFNPEAISVADAKGLTQVIPSTAQYIAGELNWPNFQDRDLLRPYVSVAFGAFYLDEQLRLFEGNRAAAIAAYNAGPGYTLDWVRLSGGDVDSLASVISFNETERYLKRIYYHYNNYRRLYGVE